MTERVRSFYDRHPYPPPVDDLEAYRRQWDDPRRRRADHHLFWPARPYRDDGSILVAGCGTSQGAKHALRWPRARVTAIDLSDTSIRHTEALRRKHDLANLEIRRLAIERVGELGATFEQIVCTGVLHHLADPDAGLAALAAALAPGGAMHLMVYAPYGRTGVYMLQELCRRIGVSAEDGELRDLIAALAALPPDHPAAGLLRSAPDLRDPAAIADALLHPQDRAYSVPQLFDFVERAGLRFARWVRQAPYLPGCGAMARLPQRARIAGLPRREQYAAAELFRGTMVRHSAVVVRGDDPAPAAAAMFEGDAWLRWVPIPSPDTVCVDEGLPPGAAAVLINRGHTFRDLYVPLDAAEKRLYDAVDGERSIADMTDVKAAAGPVERARIFFERLYEHDQVVFDASR